MKEILISMASVAAAYGVYLGAVKAINNYDKILRKIVKITKRIFEFGYNLWKRK